MRCARDGWAGVGTDGWRWFAKGQVMAEAIVIGALAMVLFLAFFTLYAEEVEGARSVKSSISAGRIAEELAMKINAASRANGTSVLMTLPESLPTGEAYNVSVKSAGMRVEVSWGAGDGVRSVDVRTMTKNVTDVNISRSPGSGERVLNITNVNGVVRIA